MLEENLFLNLLDLDLQEQIANGMEPNFDVAEVLEVLLGNGSTTLQHDLEENSKQLMTRKFYSITGRITF